MEKETTTQTLAEWSEGVTMDMVANAALMTVFVIFILILVLRTFRNKASA